MAKKPGGRAFGQDLGHGEGSVAPAKGPMRRGKPKADSKTFGTAVQKGAPGSFPEQLVGGKKPTAVPGGGGRGAYIQSDGRRADPKYECGLLDVSPGVKDSAFYAKKRAVEAVLGRELTVDEFMAEHYVADDAPTAMGTSIFDPVLAELSYRWWCPPGGLILDPFAGGSVRGVVAGILGRRYVGVDLRPEQVQANRIQAELIFEGRDAPKPEWIEGDSLHVLQNPTSSGLGEAPDFVFSCPPYADLERYSDDPRDLSTMGYDAFVAAYRLIIRLACERLVPDRFAAFVVGDVRDSRGCYRSFPQHTIEAFEAAGLSLYNDAILVTAAGSLPVRAGRQFSASRKLGNTHQRVLVFVKGDPKAAADAVGPVEFGDIPGAPEDSGADEGSETDEPAL